MIYMKENNQYRKTLCLYDEFLIFPRESNPINVTKNV